MVPWSHQVFKQLESLHEIVNSFIPAVSDHHISVGWVDLLFLDLQNFLLVLLCWNAEGRASVDASL